MENFGDKMRDAAKKAALEATKASKEQNEQQDHDQLDLTNIALDLDSLELNELLINIGQPDLGTIAGIIEPVALDPMAQDVPGSPPEPVYTPKEQGDIQGNIIPGFNKPHQDFLFYRICDRKKTKQFLKWLTPYISSMEEVLRFRRLYRSTRFRLGKDNTFMCSTWVNIAFSNEGVALLTDKANAAMFGDESYRQGMAERSSYLGDPTNPKAQGNPNNWSVGGEDNEAHIIIIVGSDGPTMLEDMVKIIKTKAAAHALELMYEQDGHTLPGALRGHEHFGFKDGISQPGVRGKLSVAPGDYITPRYLDNNDDRRLYFSKPGQLLNWPGQFLLGEPRQSTENLTSEFRPANNFPKWARRGSYLVVRKLNQDVPAFWSFAKKAATALGMDHVKFASMLVGRWQSGAPVMRVPGADDPALGADEFANNHFIFDDDTRPSNLKPIPGYGGDVYPQATADFLSKVCPHFSHIRKVNPRDGAPEMGKPQDSLARMILRRGIPFGPPVIGLKEGYKDVAKEERGLMFLCYASTIEDQFEFLQRRWANSESQPNLGGHDPVIGQQGEDGTRARTIEFPLPGGGVTKLRFKKEWVVPTAGGYFFAPTISAIRDTLAG
jgi:Dyp-type peroxidase family